MVNSQEIIERSIYSALLGVAVKLGYSVNPEDFLPINAENSKKFKEAISKLKKFVQVFGTGNNQSKDKKETPRIVVNARGFYPGSIGLPRELITKEEGIGFTATEYPYETIDQYIDIHLVAGTQEDLRLLHQIMFYAIPQRGYIKPYTEDSFLFTGNIFIELVNFFDIPNLDMGLLEKIYQFQVMDCILEEIPGEVDFVPITTIDVLLENYGYTLLEVPEKELPPIPPPIEEDIVYGSGKKFPIWNSIAGTDKIKSFKLLGYTVQNGTPTPEAPIPLLSVGDEGLKLCISDSETGIALQVIDFGDIVLRSLPDGTCDSIEWDGKNWRHVQRVWRTDLSNAYYHNTTAKFAMANLNPTYGGLHNNPNYVMSNRFVIGSFEDMSNNIGISYINAVNSTYAFNFENEPGTNKHVREWLADNPTELIYKLSTPIETILEGIPSPQTFDNETWFGTPSALVKPYMEATVKVKKAVEFVKDNLVEWYDFAPGNWQDNKIYNKINSEQYIQAHNFADTPNSGAADNYTQFDGIDDYFTDNNNVDSIFFQIYATDLVGVETGNRWLLAYDLGVPNTGLFINNNTYLICNNGSFSIDEGEKNNNIPRDLWGTGIHSYQGFSNSVGSLSCIGNYNSGDFYTKYKLYALLTYSSELTSEQIANNLNCFKQFKGVDGDINIIPEPEVYYDFSLYNNTDFPTTIENLATDKSKALQLFNFAGTEESGFFEGALISDGVDDYAVIQNDAEGFRTVFMEAIPMSAGTMLYNQRIHGYIEEPFAIYLQSNSIAYNARNPGGITYINGVLNESILVQDLLNNKHIITIVNDSLGGTQYLFSWSKGTLSSKAKTFKFIGFKEALTAEQIQEVINQYFSKNLLADFNGDLLTDSEGYFLTSN